MLYCEFCHQDVADGTLSCPRCGGPVVRKPGETAAQQQPPGQAPPAGVPPVMPPPAQSAPPSQPAQPPQAQPPAQQYTQPPQAQQPAPPSPLAKEEFFGLVDEEDSLAPEEATFTGAPPVIPPGNGVQVPPAYLEQPGLTGGYQGPDTFSVAGAGQQTADDPFGLNVTEGGGRELPPLERSWRYSSGHNILMMVVTFLIMAAIVFVGLYFGFLRKGNADATAPLQSVKDFYTYAVAEQYDHMDQVAIPNAPMVLQVQAVLSPLKRDGFISLSNCDGKVLSVSGNQAVVNMTNVKVKVKRTETSETYVKDLLDKTTLPAPMPANVTLIKQNGKWLINN